MKNHSNNKLKEKEVFRQFDVSSKTTKNAEMKSTEILKLLEKIEQNFMISRNGGIGFYNLSILEIAKEIIKTESSEVENLMDLIVGKIQINELMQKYSSNNYYFMNFVNTQPQIFLIEEDINQLNNYAKEYVFENNIVELLENKLYQAKITQPKKNKVNERNQIGYIYLIKSELGCKIGKTKNIKQREKFFSVKMPFEFHFEDYKKCLNYHLIELELHKKYEGKRINGEWFNLSDLEINEIKIYLAEIEIKSSC